jgi:hypothetical protein
MTNSMARRRHERSVLLLLPYFADDAPVETRKKKPFLPSLAVLKAFAGRR